MACALSTLIAGIIGTVYHPHFQRGKWDGIRLFTITVVSEMVEMAMILLISRPFDMALVVVKTIALPMILLNSFGMLIFMATFKMSLLKRTWNRQAS
jgi:two-component system sensor histidine kinase LytS